MRIYISGPITGTTDYMDRFEWVESNLRYLGAEVVNPAMVNSLLPETTTHREYMITSIAMLKICDTIYMLQGWEHSKGARQEYRYARKHGYQILFEGRCSVIMGITEAEA
ncbi:MAG: DUF4406 domain-containing protein [Lachnospiraceae bacterium]|nr:DUF4406 domain-containing protein [Lachnospiraceae bacterium]